jgi:perosamine synthetase
MVGFKYKMSNIQAAIGCAQMERIDELIAGKRRIFTAYRDGLADVSGISMNPEPAGTQNGFWMPTVVFSEATGVTREALQAAFLAGNIDARVFFWPLSSLPPFAEVRRNRYACDLPGRAINLPSYIELSTAEIDRVIGIIRSLKR